MVKNLPSMQETLVQFLGQEDPLEKAQTTLSSISWGFPGGKESACNVGDLGSTPGLVDPLEEGMETHSNILPWRTPIDREA